MVKINFDHKTTSSGFLCNLKAVILSLFALKPLSTSNLSAWRIFDILISLMISSLTIGVLELFKWLDTKKKPVHLVVRVYITLLMIIPQIYYPMVVKVKDRLFGFKSDTRLIVIYILSGMYFPIALLISSIVKAGTEIFMIICFKLTCVFIIRSVVNEIELTTNKRKFLMVIFISISVNIYLGLLRTIIGLYY